MKKSTNYLLAGALVMSSVGLAGMVTAMPYGDGPGCGRGGNQVEAGYKRGGRGFNVDRMAQRLDLTDDQRTQLQAVLAAAKPRMSDLRSELQASRKKLRELMQTSPIDEAEVRNIAETQGDLKADMIVLRAQQRAEINAVLTDEQRTQWVEMRGKRRRYR